MQVKVIAIEPQQKTISDRIKSFGDEADKALESIQDSGTKIGKRLIAIIGVLAVGLTAGFQSLKGFHEKLQTLLESGSVEKIEDKPDSRIFKVRGRPDSKDITESRSPREK